MSSWLQTSYEVELDLSFNGANEDLLKYCSDNSAKYVLTQASFWEENLRNWICYIRSQKSLMCPEVVRLANSFSLGMHFIDDSRIAELNAVWRQKPEKTDVLSFPALDEGIFIPEGQCVELGDIVVSVPTAKRQSKEYQCSFDRELQWLVTHGLLHLLGWDHPNSMKLSEMLSCQEHLLAINGNLLSNDVVEVGDVI